MVCMPEIMQTTTRLPHHLGGLERVWVDQSVLDAPLVRRVLERTGDLPLEVVQEGRLPALPAGSGRTLYLKRYRGRFLRSCPGTRHYHCCGYLIVHIGENCPLFCSYCILQAYFQDRVLKVWANQEDLYAELEQAFRKWPQRRWRLGTGEFTDSLALEPLTGYSRDLVAFLDAFS